MRADFWREYAQHKDGKDVALPWINMSGQRRFLSKTVCSNNRNAGVLRKARLQPSKIFAWKRTPRYEHLPAKQLQLGK